VRPRIDPVKRNTFLPVRSPGLFTWLTRTLSPVIGRLRPATPEGGGKPGAVLGSSASGRSGRPAEALAVAGLRQVTVAPKECWCRPADRRPAGHHGRAVVDSSTRKGHPRG
jgi:hypothetical protein